MKWLKKVWNWFKNLFKFEPSKKEEEEVPLYLAVNGLYIAWIESIERQIEQTKIDFALGTISKETYDRHFEEFQEEVKRLSGAYARELLIYSS